MQKNILVSRLIGAAIFLLPFQMAIAEDLPAARNTQVIVGIETFKLDTSLYGVKQEEENGWRGSVGIGWSNLFIPTQGSVYRANFTVYGGLTDYENSVLAATSNSKYAGLKLEGMAGYRFGSIVGMEVFSGIGADFWYHGIDQSATMTSNFDEYYATASAKLGLSFLQRFNSFGYFLRAGMKAPFLTWNHVNVSDGVDLTPVPKLSGFAELNFTFGSIPRDRFVLTFYYDSYRFGRSKSAEVTDHGVPTGATISTPATNMDMLGIQATFGF